MPDGSKLPTVRRLPETHQTRNGQHWRFGLKMPVGVDTVAERFLGLAKLPYRGRARNATRSFVVLGLANIHLARQRLV